MSKVINFNADDYYKLNRLADWFDIEQHDNRRWDGKQGSHEVQKDLRRMASIISQFTRVR